MACVEATTSLSEALQSMRENRVSCVLVCAGEKIEGIFTERDFLTKVAGASISMDSPVGKFMTPNPKVLTAEDLVSDAILLMEGGDYRHVPVVGANGRVEGMISIHNIIEFLAEMFPEEVLNLPPRPDQYMRSQEGG
jgi:CBS domain-containing protein